jgi:uncharacterized protein (TIGR00369 family)
LKAFLQRNKKYPTMTDDIPVGFAAESDDDRFFDMIGPVYAKRDGDTNTVFAFRAARKHTNKRDVVQGGMLVTLADHTLAIACWNAAGGSPCATISLNTDFLAAGRDGDWIEASAEIIRLTRSLVFGRSFVHANGKLILTANGVWKRLGTN